MHNILLVSADNAILQDIRDVIDKNSFSEMFKCEVSKGLSDAETLIQNKDFFAVFVDADLYDDLCLEIHKFSFLARHDVYVVGIGQKSSPENIAHLMKCGFSDFISTKTLKEFVEGLFKLADVLLAKGITLNNAFKKLFLPQSLDGIILSSMIHEVRNSNNISSLNAEMANSFLSKSKGNLDDEQFVEVKGYLKRLLEGIYRTSSSVENFSYIKKTQSNPMGSVSDFHKTLEDVLTCFSHKFTKIYTEVITDCSFKMPYLKMAQRDLFKILLNMAYISCLSLETPRTPLKIKVFGDTDKSGFSFAFTNAFLYKEYFCKEKGKRLFIPAEYLCSLDVLKGFTDVYGGSFSFKENQDMCEIEVCFSSELFYS